MNKENLKKELKKLFKSMDFIADKYLLKKKITRKDASKFYTIYQQLGLLWEYLSCHCKHWDGHKKKGNKFLCRICGKVKGVREEYYLLPVEGKKVIGRMIRPRENRLKGVSEKKAKIIDDAIKFHGAKLKVSVFNGYVSKLSKIDKEINVAPDRIVTLEESGLSVEISKYISAVKIRSLEKQKPIYSEFLWELPKRILKKFPIMLSFNKNRKLVEIELIR